MKSRKHLSGTGPSRWQWSRRTVALAVGLAIAGTSIVSAPVQAAAPSPVVGNFKTSDRSQATSWDETNDVPKNTVKPRISGKLAPGSRLRVDTGSWVNADYFLIDWMLNNVVQAEQYNEDDWTYSTDPDGSFLIPASAVGKTVSVRVTTDDYYADPVSVTVSGGKIAAAAFSKAPTPTISGTAAVGSKLTVKTGTWSPKPALKFQWFRGNSPIQGATKTTYAAVAADKGKQLKVRVTATRSGFTRFEKYSSVKKVAAGSIKPRKSLSIAGHANAGKTVTVSASWPAGTKANYQWYRDGKKIKSGTKTSLKLTSKDIGKRILVKATVTKKGYTTYKASAKSLKVGKALITVKTKPKITGTKKAGMTLRASAGSYSVKPTSHSYRWYRNGKAISKATRSSYRLTTADRGKKISVKVIAMRKNYVSLTASSSAVTIPIPVRTVISRDGTYKVGSAIKPGLYKATGSGKSCYWARTSGFSGSFSQIKANYFGAANTYVRIVSGDKGFKTSGCGKWATVSNIGAKSSTITKDGTYRVGIDIKPGVYSSSSRGSGCYWATLNDFTGNFNDVEENYFGSANTIVEVPSYVAGFKVSGCGTLRR